MKKNLQNRLSFWNPDSKKNYINDAICILNDEFKINIILLTKCGSSTIRHKINYREKLFSNLTNDELNYKKIAFVRDPEKRFYSGVGEIAKRNEYKKDRFENILNDKSKIIEYILQNRDEHLTSIEVLISNIKVDFTYNLSLLSNMEKQNTSISNKRVNRYIAKVKNYDIFNNDKIKKYYENDKIMYENSLQKINDMELIKLLGL